MKFLIVLLASVVLASANFTNYKVYRVVPKNPQELGIIKNFEQNEEHFDFWSKARAINHNIDVMVSPQFQDSFRNTLNSFGINYRLLISDVESVVQREQMEKILAPRSTNGVINLQQYQTYDKIVEYMRTLEKNHPEIVTVEVIGETSEGRDLVMIKISTGGNNKPAILIDAGIHAREWIAPATVVNFISLLVENESNRHMIESADWLIIPVLNPDGYEFTHSSSRNRLWRKTRSAGSRCVGVDGNRNFDHHWMEVGASNNECSDTYAGPNAFSEAETRAIKDLVTKYGSQIKLYLSHHSYGNYLLYPWGYTSDLPEDWETLDELAHQVGTAIYNVFGTRYTIGSSTNVLYAAAGGSDDWVKAVGGVQLAYTIELPGGGWNGFDPPASDIADVVRESWEGIKAYHRYIVNNN